MTEQEHVKKIEEVLDQKKYSDVIVLSNDMISEAYSKLAQCEHVSEDAKYDIDKAVIFKFLSEHDMSQVLWMKGVAALHLADFSLAGRSFHDAISMLPTDTISINPYLGSAFILCIQGDIEAATRVVRECKEKYPYVYQTLNESFDEMYDDFLSDEFIKPETKEEFKKLFFIYRE